MMWDHNNKKKDGQGDSENFTFLGKDVTFKGVVTFDGMVRIDSHLEGEIHTKGTIVVGEHAVIKGLITAGSLISSGKIMGTITASEKVQLLKSGILIGEVHAPLFSMEEGAHFQGLCDMGPS
ncbi:MAG: bactofilin family protein, partial [Nitrospiraceae bacterium]